MKTKPMLTFLLLLAFLLAACAGNTNPASLADTAWVLEQINGQPVVENTLPTLSFGADGQAGGHGSCNGFGGTYEAKNGQLTFGPLFSTMMACLELGVMEQEMAYLESLQSAAAYRVEDGRLLILDAAGAVTLAFVPQDLSLEGKTWSLTAFNDGQNLVGVMPDSLAGGLPDTQISAEFKAGNISGSAGCNSYSAPSIQDGRKLSFGPLAGTKMFCGEPAGLMEQETAYLNALARVESYNINGNRLTLFDAEGLVMAEFVK